MSSSPSSRPYLSRRTSTADASVHDPLPENVFWQQAHRIFTSVLLKKDYDRDYYVEVQVSPTHTLTTEIESFALATDVPQCLLLVGQEGVGKSSLLSHFWDQRIASRAAQWAWIYFDGSRYRDRIGAERLLLSQGLLATVVGFLREYLVRNKQTELDFLDDVFLNDPGLEPIRFLNSDAAPETKRDLTRRYLQQALGVYLDASLSFLCRHFPPGQVVLVLDNLDPLPTPIQVEAVQQAIALSVSSGSRAIVSVQRTTEAELRYSDPGLFGQFIRTEMQAPSLLEVIRRRVARALDTPEVQEVKIGSGSYVFAVRECPEFARILVDGLASEGVQRILNGLSNGSVREGLRMASSIYASPHLNPKRVVAKLSPPAEIIKDLWRDFIPDHVALRSLVLRTAPMYNPANTWVGNVFGTAESRTHLGPFLRLLILRLLRTYSRGQVEVQVFIDESCQCLRAGRSLVESELTWLERQGWVELHVPDLNLKRRGRFICDELVFHRDYLTHISTDVDMYPDAERQLRSIPASFPEQARNLTILLKYLAEREVIMLASLAENGLAEYCDRFGSTGIVTEIVSRIAENLLELRPDPPVVQARALISALQEGDALTSIRDLLRRYSI